jgi:mono/diheme cytochrome c family protein
MRPFVNFLPKYKSRPRSVVGCLLTVAVLMLVPLRVTAEDSVPADGQAIYQDNCAVCHGDRGDGMTRARRGLNPPPRDFTTRLARAELNGERLITSISHGRPGTAMMAFEDRLSPQQIKAVAEYIQDTFMAQEAVELDEAMVRLGLGKRLYTSNCAVCHGDDGNGAMWTKTSLNPPPRDFTTLAAIDELSRERMVTSVTHGRPGTAMMAFSQRLTGDEIEAVVDYVRQTFIGRVKQADSGAAASPHGLPPSHAPVPAQPEPAQVVAVDMSRPFPGELVGDVDKGRQFYMNNCFTCHGKLGDGEGPRAHFNRPRPRNFLSEASRLTLNRPALFKAIYMGKTGTVMPAWSKVLSEAEIADVAEFVFQAFIQSSIEPDGETGDDQENISLDNQSGKKKVDG